MSIRKKKFSKMVKLLTYDKQADRWQGQGKNPDFFPLTPEGPEGTIFSAQSLLSVTKLFPNSFSYSFLVSTSNVIFSLVQINELQDVKNYKINI